MAIFATGIGGLGSARLAQEAEGAGLANKRSKENTKGCREVALSICSLPAPVTSQYSPRSFAPHPR